MRTFERLYRFALREGDRPLAEALERAVTPAGRARASPTPLARRTVAALEDALGLHDPPD